jgi:protein-L-isoaspartate O-methyltransferase
MSKKENKFEPSNGLKVAVHFNIIAIRAVAQELDMFPEVLAEKLDSAGFMLVPDPFNMSSDAGKVIVLQNKRENSNISLVQNPVQEETDDE